MMTQLSDIQRDLDIRGTDVVEWLSCKRCGCLFPVRVTIGTNGNVLDEGQPEECEECREEAENDQT